MEPVVLAELDNSDMIGVELFPLLMKIHFAIRISLGSKGLDSKGSCTLSAMCPESRCLRPT